jgi:hypothetical protein
MNDLHSVLFFLTKHYCHTEQLFSCVRRNGSIGSNVTQTGRMIHGTAGGSVARSIQQTLWPATLVVWCSLLPPACATKSTRQSTQPNMNWTRLPHSQSYTWLYSSCTHRHIAGCTGRTASTRTEIRKIKIYNQFCISVKLGLSKNGKNIGWGSSRQGCWGKHLNLQGRREDWIMRLFAVSRLSSYY